jgi:hypothetical protein
LRADARLLEGQLSSRKVYEVAHTLGRLPKPDVADDTAWARVLALEVSCSLARIHAGGGGLDFNAVGLLIDDRAGYRAVRAGVTSWIGRMLVSRTFASAAPRLRQRGGREVA